MWTYELETSDVAEAIASYFEGTEVTTEENTIRMKNFNRAKMKNVFSLLNVKAPYRRNTDIEPAIYAACLAAYNEGKYHGVWISTELEPEEMEKAIKYMLLKSPATGEAEEWAIHDTVNMEGLTIEIPNDFETIHALGEAISQNGEAMAIFINESSLDQTIEETIDEFPEKYKGSYKSEIDFVEQECDQSGWYSALEKAGINRAYLDLDAIKSDWFNETFWSKRQGASVYVYET